MYLSKIFFIYLLIIGCSPIQISSKNYNTAPFVKNHDIAKLITNRRQYLTETYSRIDTLLSSLLETEPPHTFCEAYENIFFKELSFYYTTSIEFEDYIFGKIVRPHPPLFEGKWIDCLMLVMKRDCEGDNEWRLKRLPRILRDTTSIDNSYYLLSRVSHILQEPCATTLKVLQNEVDLRKNLFNSMLVQEEFIKNNPIENSGPLLGLDDVFSLMNELPDRLTSKFAYDYVMLNDSIPWEIQDIISNRIFDIGDYYDISNLHGYSKYAGDPIIYTESELISLAERLTYIQSKRKCDWCKGIVSSIKERD